MSSQKKRREREAALAYYHKNKRPQTVINQPPVPQTPPLPVSPSAQPAMPHRSTISRLKKHFGGNLILSLKGLIRSVSKRKKDELNSAGITYNSPTKKMPETTSDQAYPSSLCQKRDKNSLAVKRFLKGLSPKRLYQKKAKHAALIKKFYNAKSNFLPGKAGIPSSLKVKKCLDKSIVQLHQDFIMTHGTLVSRATFFRHRPKNIISFAKTPFKQCLCELCLNPMLKVKVLNSLGWPRIDTLRDLLSLTLCASDSKKCLYRMCNKCNANLVVDAVNSLDSLDNTVCWQRWERVKRGKGVRMDLIKKEGVVRDLMNELKSELVTLPVHDFVHRWQSKQFSSLISEIPESWAVVVLDFAENYLCVQQDQPQSAYFSYSQVTVHPCVMYYGCSCGMRITDNWTFVSDVLVHSADMVHCITQKILSHLRSLHVSRAVVYSDGCASQYKSRLPFSYLQSYAVSASDGLQVQRCYFGARHGKNPCDALGGLLKQAASRSVRSRKSIIQNAKDLFMFASENLSVQPSTSQGICTHMRRTYFHLQEEDIVQSSLNFPSVGPLKGTRKLHDILSTTKGLLVRNLSCFCPPCRVGNFKLCESSSHVDTFQICDQFLSNSNSDLNDAFLEPEPDENDVSVVSLGSVETVDVEVVSPISTADELPAQVQHSRSTFFSDVQSIFSSCTSFDELLVAVREISPSLDMFPLPSAPFHTLRSSGSNVDEIALKHFAPLGIKHLFPVETVGDGNCVPRALSLHCFGDQDSHLEIRVRIVHEMVSNSMDYMCLSPEDLAFLFCNSDYQSDSPESVFRLEALNVCKTSVYMGMWQLMAAANALNVNLLSLYPRLGPSHYHSFYTRPLKARQTCSSHAFALFWTSTLEHESVMPQDYWTANHIVPLLPEENPTVVDIDEIL